MDPVSTAIIAGLVAGVANGVTEVSKKVIVDAYEALKATLEQKFGAQSKVVKAVEELEEAPQSSARKAVVEEEVKGVNADQDPEILAAAQALLDKIKAQPGGPEQVQMIASGSYIAQASHGGTATVSVNRPDKEQQS